MNCKFFTCLDFKSVKTEQKTIGRFTMVNYNVPFNRGISLSSISVMAFMACICSTLVYFYSLRYGENEQFF